MVVVVVVVVAVVVMVVVLAVVVVVVMVTGVVVVVVFVAVVMMTTTTTMMMMQTFQCTSVDFYALFMAPCLASNTHTHVVAEKKPQKQQQITYVTQFSHMIRSGSYQFSG